MSATSRADDVLRGPKYAMVAWLLGPLPMLVLWLSAPVNVDRGWAVLVMIVFLFVHWVCLLVSLVVLSHLAVWKCIEGWLLGVYWLGIAGVAWAVLVGHGGPGWLPTTSVYTLCVVAAAMPVVFVVRLAARQWAARAARAA
jgi:hypothetical protein